MASPTVTAPEDPNHWVLLMPRMRLRLGAGEPWQPGKNGGCHGNERRSILSRLWARDAPGGMGSRTRPLPQGQGRPKPHVTLQERRPALRLPLADSAWWGWAVDAAGAQALCLALLWFHCAHCHHHLWLFPGSPSRTRCWFLFSPEEQPSLQSMQSQERPRGFLQPGSLPASLVMSMNAQISCQPIWGYYPPPANVSPGCGIKQVSAPKSLGLEIICFL